MSGDGLRSRIVASARALIGTPYAHQGRTRGVGVDCIGLVLLVARECGIVPEAFDIADYGRVPDGVTLLAELRERLLEVPHDALRPGDVVCVSMSRHPHHVGIVGDYVHGGLSIIHASDHVGRVVEHRLLFGQMAFVAGFAMAS